MINKEIIYIFLLIVFLYIIYQIKFNKEDFVNDISSNLVNYYPFENTDISSILVKNNASNNYDLTLYNGASINSNTFKIGTSCLYLNNSINNQYVLINSDTINITTNGLTFACWFKFNNRNNGHNVFNFCNDPYNWSDNIIFCTRNANGRGHFTVHQKDGKYYSYNLGINLDDDNRWYHVVWTLSYAPINSNFSTWKVYLDGVLKETITDTIYPSLIKRKYNYLGYDNLVSVQYSNGYIDDFRIYNRVLDLTDITMLKNNTNITIINNPTTQQIPKNNLIQVSLRNNTDNYVLNEDGDNVFRNGIYSTSCSSCSSGDVSNVFNLHDNQDSKYWVSGISTSTNYTRNSYNGQSPSLYVDGGTDRSKFITTLTNRTTISGEWIQIQLPYRTQITTYTILTIKSSWDTYGINAFSIVGSNDGSSWELINSQSLSNVKPTTPIITYNVPETLKYYSYLRLIITQLLGGNTQAGIAKWYISGLLDSTYPIQSLPSPNLSRLSNYYPFELNDKNGATIKNNVNNNYDLILYNGASINNNTYKFGSSSLYLNNDITNQYASIKQNAFSITTTGLTFACWFKFYNRNNGHNIFNFCNDPYNWSDNIIFCTRNANGRGHFTVHQTNGEMYSYNLGDNLDDNKWYHVAWTLSYTTTSTKTSTWKVYLNGVLRNTITDAVYPKIGNRKYNLIGYDNLVSAQYSNGNIDDFRIYNRILSDDEIILLLFKK